MSFLRISSFGIKLQVLKIDCALDTVLSTRWESRSQGVQVLPDLKHRIWWGRGSLQRENKRDPISFSVCLATAAILQTSAPIWIPFEGWCCLSVGPGFNFPPIASSKVGRGKSDTFWPWLLTSCVFFIIFNRIWGRSGEGAAKRLITSRATLGFLGA